MDRMVSISIGTDGTEDHAKTYRALMSLALDLNDAHDYINVSTQSIDRSFATEDDTEECLCEDLRYDDNTMNKVRAAIAKTLIDNFDLATGHEDPVIDDMIIELQNAGILFRERM